MIKIINMDRKKLLKEVFGIDAFRDKQEEAIDSLLNGQNTLCMMPTGMGKSLIYQFTTIAKGKMAIVFSPLLALMGQQMDILNHNLKNSRFSAVAYNSTLNSIKQYQYLKDSFKPPFNPTFLFLSPEKVMTDGLLLRSLRAHKEKIGLIVIDEAHCISQWGHSFRPAYKMIPHFIKTIFPNETPPILCLTATINERDKQEIIKEFQVQSIVKSESLYRNNIHLNILPEVKNNKAKRDALEKILNDHKGQKTIVYTHIIKREYGTREMSDYFKAKGFSGSAFDSNMPDNQKVEILENFSKGEIQIVFATSAFGMGIDIPDIRCVCHYLVPESLEQYYQEVGRAGRDGKESYAYLLHAEPNLRIKKDQLSKENISPDKIEEKFNSLLGKKRANSLPYIGQLSQADYDERNIILIIFLKMIQYGIIQIVDRGISNIKCFEETKCNPEFNTLKNITNNGSIKLISKRKKTPINGINDTIFTLFLKGHIKTISSPDKVIFYQVNRMPKKNDFERLSKEIKSIVEYKHNNLNVLGNVLNGEYSINEALFNHLGIA